MNAGIMQNPWVRYAVLVLGWLFLGFVLSLELFFNYRAMKPEAWVDFIELAMPQFGRAMMWALMAPLILRMRTMWPLSRGHWIGGVGFHLAMSFVVMATYYLGRMLSYSIFWDDLVQGFWESAWKGFYGRNMIDMAYYWAVLAFGYGLELQQRYRSEELKSAQLEARLVETELKALREQLRPHFLFNTLNTIAVLVRENKNTEAVRLIAQLSTLLRLSLEQARVPEITVRQEVDFLERYLEIQQARFPDRLRVTMQIDEAALEARIPNLLLQPLVENAIVHGVAPQTKPGNVEITGRVEAGRLHLAVKDDGPGMAADGRRVKEGVGLANTRERLAKTYGSQGQFVLRSDPGRGVSVQISLPFRT